MIEIPLFIEHRIIRQFVFEIRRSDHAILKQRSRVVALPVLFVRMPHHHRDARYFSGESMQGLRAGVIKAITQQQIFRRITAQAEFGCKQ